MVVDLIDSQRDTAPSSLYVHIPFCQSRCFYCDFNTYVAPTTVMASYVSALDVEFSLLAKQTDVPLRTVFFGGGTPTLPSAALLSQMLLSLHRHFCLQPDAEITFESNPESIDDEKLAVLRDAGVTRLSFGAQTFRDRLLMTIGRAHDAEDVKIAVDKAARAGFRHINIDLMFGLPEQTMEDVQHALDQVLALPVDHVSAYWLKVEEGTPFDDWKRKGELPLPGEDLEADMYHVVREKLTGAGFYHYEISNFAKAGGEARHNLVYWRNQSYLAAGAGAHGYVRGTRYENVKKIPDYIGRIEEAKRPIHESFDISGVESAEDTMMLGLRLAEGVVESHFEDRYGRTIETQFGRMVQSLLDSGLLVRQRGRLRIPDAYWPVANGVFEKFISLAAAN